MHAPAVHLEVKSAQLQFTVNDQVWALDKPFRISRGTRTEARVVVATVSDGEYTGRGEAVPSKRYGEDVASVTAQLKQVFPKLKQGADREQLEKLLGAGAARNALDCALWDLDAKRSGKRVWELAQVRVNDNAETAFTISLDTPETMAADAQASRQSPILKLKLGGDHADLARVQAVRKVAPAPRLLIDANESWSAEHFRKIIGSLAELRVELIEQPFPATDDQVLEDLEHPVPICADESCHTSADIPRLLKRYDAINVKLDKTGGLTEALRLTTLARENGFKILIGCMVATSLAMAPARLLAGLADFIDLDGPLLLAGDRHHGLRYDRGNIGLPSRELWG